ncbi:unnamed protein product [Merluccius merluccius]
MTNSRFSSIATSQAKHLSALGSSCCGNRGTSQSECSASVAHNDTTLPWFGSATPGGKLILSDDVPALGDDMWPILGVKPKSQACSTPCNSKHLNILRSLQLGDHQVRCPHSVLVGPARGSKQAKLSAIHLPA